MSDWNKFNAVVRDRSGIRHSPPMFSVIVWGVTIETARDKLEIEYPRRHYEIVSLDAAVTDQRNPNDLDNIRFDH